MGGYRGRHNVSEDQDLFLRLAEVGRVANLPEPLLLYRRHYQSVMHTQWEQREEKEQNQEAQSIEDLFKSPQPGAPPANAPPPK